MECIETTLNRIFKYNNLLEDSVKKLLPDNIETEELLKTFGRYRKLYEIIGKLFFPKTPKKKYFEAYLNETYTSLRKLHMMISGHDKSTVFSRDKCIKDVKQCIQRNDFLIDDYLSTLRKFEEKYKKKVPKKFSPGPIIDNDTKFLLTIKYQIYLPMSCENIFVNMVQYKDQVYYVETNDLISFFYFYRTDDGWYWSPPKKTDPEDIWIECPQTTINEGYWTGKIIPTYIAEFIIWLHLFFPNIPEFYLKFGTDSKDESKKSENKKDKKDKKNKEKNNNDSDSDERSDSKTNKNKKEKIDKEKSSKNDKESSSKKNNEKSSGSDKEKTNKEQSSKSGKEKSSKSKSAKESEPSKTKTSGGDEEEEEEEDGD